MWKNLVCWHRNDVKKNKITQFKKYFSTYEFNFQLACPFSLALSLQRCCHNKTLHDNQLGHPHYPYHYNIVLLQCHCHDNTLPMRRVYEICTNKPSPMTKNTTLQRKALQLFFFYFLFWDLSPTLRKHVSWTAWNRNFGPSRK